MKSYGKYKAEASETCRECGSSQIHARGLCRKHYRRAHHKREIPFHRPDELDKRLAKIWSGINARCTNPNASRYEYYGGRGIKNRITIEELRQLWERDNAAAMERPSIDRYPDDDGDYELTNCRFIELRDNLSRTARRKRGIQALKPEPTSKPATTDGPPTVSQTKTIPSLARANAPQRELMTAREVADRYLPFSVTAILHGECGTHVLTRVEAKAPGKARGRVLFLRSEVEAFEASLIETARRRAGKRLYAVR